MAKTNFYSIDEYIAACPEGTRERLQEIRRTIKKIAPKAKEKISYQIAAFELNGMNLIYFAGWKNHISVYPIPAVTKALEKELSPYMDGKGTLKFTLDEPLPLKLIGEVVKARVAGSLKNAANQSTRKNH